MIEFSDKHDITLELNGKNQYGNNSIITATENNNTTIVRLITDYVLHKKLLLDINERNIIGDYQILNALKNNNLEIIDLLRTYSIKNNIDLFLRKEDIRNTIENLDNISIEILNYLNKYNKDRTIKN